MGATEEGNLTHKTLPSHESPQIEMEELGPGDFEVL